ncbi:MAG: hypothetical protein IKF07_05970 [Eubacterium sp.]|nr:hypothetical protein [Eubacterium sp.]
MMKKMLALALSLAMICGALPMTVSADTKSNAADKHAKAFAQEILRQNENRDPFAFLTKASRLKLNEGEALPEKWDLSSKFLDDGDDKSYVTPVRFQNPFGTCWGFSAMAAAESSLLSSGLAETDGYNDKTLDLSEKHLVYFVSQYIDDENHRQYGEGTHSEKGISVVDMLNRGGQMTYATSLFSSGMGPNLENRDKLDPEDEHILEYKGREGNVQKRRIDGVLQDYCYDDEDDWSIPSKYRFYQSYVLKESSIFPTPAMVDESGYEYDEDATKAIKRELMNNRAVTVAFHADSFMPSQEAGDGQYISKDWAHYTYDANRANHGVCIVGWDDTIGAEGSPVQFVEGHKPPAPGAWLVKNSWGSGEEEFPAKGGGNWGIQNKEGKGTGYFWLSYYDQSLAMIESFEFDKSNIGKKYYLDQHDLLGTSNYMTVEDADLKFANVFQAEVCQNLEQVSCQTTHPDTKVISEIYLLNEGFTDPTDGKLIDTIENTYAFGGFHKMDLNVPQTIMKGQHYSVVQTHILADGIHSIVFPQGLGKEYSNFLDLGTWGVGVVNEKESYVLDDTGWTDFTEIVKYLNSGEEKDFFAYDNLPIKAYNTEATNIRFKVPDIVSVSSTSISNEDWFRVVFKGDAGLLPDDVKVDVTLEEGGDQIASVTQDYVDDTKITVRGLKEGTTNLYVEASYLDGGQKKIIGTSVVKIKVIQPKFVGAFVFDREHVYTGKAIKCDYVVVVDNLGSLVDLDQFKLTYKNNVKCGEATITVSPTTDNYSGSVKATFSIKPVRGVISKVASGKKKLTVTVKNQKASGVSKYELSYRVNGTKKWKTKTYGVKSTKLVLTKLKKGKKYDIRMRAYAKGDVYGDYSKVAVSPKVK